MRRDKKDQSSVWEGLKIVNPHAAGLDIAFSEVWAAVPPERTDTPVRKFDTFTPDLEALADWLAAWGVDTVAMEATGVYWVPVYEVLEERGFRVWVVNAQHIKNVPGRKSDIQDCRWIQALQRASPAWRRPRCSRPTCDDPSRRSSSLEAADSR